MSKIVGTDQHTILLLGTAREACEYANDVEQQLVDMKVLKVKLSAEKEGLEIELSKSQAASSEIRLLREDAAVREEALAGKDELLQQKDKYREKLAKTGGSKREATLACQLTQAGVQTQSLMKEMREVMSQLRCALSEVSDVREDLEAKKRQIVELSNAVAEAEAKAEHHRSQQLIKGETAIHVLRAALVKKGQDIEELLSRNEATAMKLAQTNGSSREQALAEKVKELGEHGRKIQLQLEAANVATLEGHLATTVVQVSGEKSQ